MDEMHEFIAEYERTRIDIYWDETMLSRSKDGNHLRVFESTRTNNTQYFKAMYLQTMAGSELRGKPLMQHIRALPIEEQRSLVATHKPNSLLELKAVLLQPRNVIGPAFHEMLEQCGSVRPFIESITGPLSTTAAEYPYRYLELLTMLWAKGLYLFPFLVSTWPTPAKWLTLTDARYAGPRAALIKTVYMLPPNTSADFAWSHTCTFFAVSDISRHEDLSPSHIDDYYEVLCDRFPTEEDKKSSKARGRLRFVTTALLQRFNVANPEHAVEIKRRPRNNVAPEKRRVDGKFRWLATDRPELTAWADAFRGYIDSLNTARISSKVNRLNIFGDFICTLFEPPTGPLSIVRSKHIYDASLRNSNTFLEHLRANYESAKFRNDTLSSVRRFFDWFNDFLVATGSSDSHTFKNPIFTSDSTGKDDSPSKTERDSLPPYVIKELKEVILDNDFEFPRRNKISSVHVLDSANGDYKWVFYPGPAVCLYTLFDTPIRSHQARWLDIGVFDEFVYDPSTNASVPNPSKDAIPGRREGVLRLERDGLRANAWLTLWINTNKTAEYNTKQIGYVIPYVSEQLAGLLQLSIDWQKRYLPALKAPVPYIAYQKEVREAPRPNDVVGPQIAPLFRDPRNPDQIQPVSYPKLKRFYIQVLAEAQKRIERKYGHKLKLVTDNGKGGLTWTVDLHSLRVSGITNLIEAGVPLEVVSQFVAGHATLVMTLHYLKYSPAKLRRFLELAHERMLNDEDFVGSELFADYLDEFAPFMLGQEGTGVGAGFQALQDKTGIMTITSEGICPGTSCSEGGPVESVAQNRYAAVPGGKRCGLCRFWLTGPAHLLGQVAAVNNLAYTIRKKGLEVASLNDQRIDAEDEGNQRKARELRDRVDILNRELEIDINEWAARYRYAEKSVALMDEYLATKERVEGTDKAVPVPILTASSPLELKVTLEEAHEFALLDQITQMSEFTTGFKNREAELEKNAILSKMMVANGIKPFLLGLNEQQAHEAGNLLSALLLQQVRGHELDEVLNGKRQLNSYPGLANAFKVLEEHATPEALADRHGASRLATLVADVGGQDHHAFDDEGEELFG
ncbi:VPA1269 family protein [Paraburkholderia sp. BL9I2N2]|uniref:VPA1269 family protein n=1 Tax=Paraburkholderia sp. BL9I2N2 TaxID=1938809 RepID=UPI001404F879|nr:VPA1269 family protein [Paraburkholderia sp. BL9I2N2]